MFDVGETLVDESRLWGEWADWLGVTRLTFFAALGAVIAGKRHQGRLTRIEMRDLYPDAMPTLNRLRAAGLAIGLAGNQPIEFEAEIRALGLPVDFVASSGRWGVEKPDPAFFRRIVAESGIAPDDTAYVGDRLDNDVLPALAAGMAGIFIRRGPWGVVHATWPEVARADRRIESLEELPEALVRLSK